MDAVLSCEMGRLGRIGSVARAVVLEMRREDVTFMAASIAYHALVSMLPILFLLVLVVSTFGSAELVDTVLGLTRSFLPTAGRQIIVDALRNATGDAGLSVIGVGVLLWGTSKIFRAMDAAFAEIYDTRRDNSLLAQFRDAFVVLGTLVVIAVGAALFGTVVRIPPTVPFAESLADLVAVLGLAVAFVPIFSVFPDTDVSVREAVPGVVVAALGWAALEWLFHLYAAFTNKPDIYGLVGTLLLLVTWLYAGSLMLLVGASVNATLAGRDGKREAERRSKRTFGRRITDADSFGRRLDDLVHRADAADVSAEEIRRALRQRADEVGDSDGESNSGRERNSNEKSNSNGESNSDEESIGASGAGEPTATERTEREHERR